MNDVVIACLLKIEICNKVDMSRFKCLTIHECWRDWRDYMNEDSGVMIVRIVHISELFPSTQDLPPLVIWTRVFEILCVCVSFCTVCN